MLVEPADTPYDLRFMLFGTPVRVHPLFWLFSAIFGWNLLNDPNGDGFVRIVIWIICCFLSILLHEFGHVWMGKAFGAHDSYIVLYSMGGLAVRANGVWQRWQRIAVSLAGPGIQIALYGLIWWLLRSLSIEQLERMPDRVWFTLQIVKHINLYWALFNLVPVWPLDGGMVSREICTWLSPRGGLRISLGLSLGVGAFIAIHALLANAKGMAVIPFLPTDTYVAILFGLLAFQSWQLLQFTPKPRTYEADDRLPWESDPDAWKKR
jgi:stage IV sporulation protein FB